MRKLISFCFFLITIGVHSQVDIEKSIISEKDINKKARLIMRHMETLIQSDTTRYLYFANEIKKISQQTNNRLYLRDYFDRIGKYHYFSYNFPLAVVYFDSSFQINKAVKDTLGLISSNINLGGVQYMLRHFDISLDHYLQASSLCDQSNLENKQQFSIKGNIGMVYREIGQPEIAIKYFKEALSENEADKDTISIIKCLNNMGLLAKDLKDYIAADKYYKRAIVLASAKKSNRDLSDVYFNYGNLYLHQKNFNVALDYFGKSEEMSLSLGDESGVAETYLMMGECCKKLNKRAEALNYLNKAIHIAEKYNHHKSQMDSHYSLYQFYDEEKDYKNALAHLVLFLELKNKVDAEENMSGALLIKSEFEQKQQHQLDSIKHETEKRFQEEKNKTSLEKQRNFTLFSLFAGLLFLAIALISLRAYKNKKKSEQKINLQKTELEIKNKEIISSIEYAKTIQRSLLTTEQYILKALKRLNP